MYNQFMFKLQWRLYRIFERLGWQGNTAMTLIIVAAIGYIMLLRPLAIELAGFNQASITKPKQAPSASESNDANFSRFLTALPPLASRANAVKSLMDIAATESLVLDEVTYKTESKLNDSINHYHVQFSLIASYPEIQNFLSTLLNQLPYVSVESLTFRRDNAQDELVEARMHLVFHFNQL